MTANVTLSCMQWPYPCIINVTTCLFQHKVLPIPSCSLLSQTHPSMLQYCQVVKSGWVQGRVFLSGFLPELSSLDPNGAVLLRNQPQAAAATI